MAYVSKEMKLNLAPAIKAVLKKFNLKGTISVRNHTSLVVKIKSGPIDFVENLIETDLDHMHNDVMSADHIEYLRKRGYVDVNTYYINDRYTGDARQALLELKEAMEGPEFFCHDDIQSDYFYRSHYINILVGAWNKPYVVTE
jgi:hypothetical protein